MLFPCSHLLHVSHVPQERSPVVETIAVAHVVAISGDPVVVLVHVAIFGPFH
jgi:hypothetical protein